MKPFLGMTVIYTFSDDDDVPAAVRGKSFAAIVTDVQNGQAGLKVFIPNYVPVRWGGISTTNDVYVAPPVAYDPEGKPDTWRASDTAPPTT